MSESHQKTNAARELDIHAIPYKILQYPVDEDDLSGVHVANILGMDADMVFKTLVLRTDTKEIVMACIPAPSELDLKKFAHVTKCKNASMLPLQELQPITGYIRGGCSPIGAKKKFPVMIDELAQLYDQISISAGRRGLQILINPFDLQRITNGNFADIVR